jgi:hypothetical protein
MINLFKENPSCATWAERRGEKTREGVKSVVDLLERKRHGGGIKGLDDKSRGMEILMAEAFAKNKPTDPLILDRNTARRKRKWSDTSRYVVR